MRQRAVSILIARLTTALDIEIQASHSYRYKGDKSPISRAVHLVEQLSEALTAMEAPRGSRADNRKASGLMNIHEAARAIGITPATLWSAVDRGAVAPPEHINGSSVHGGGRRPIRRYYVREDLPSIREYFEHRPPDTSSADRVARRRASGWLSASEVAAICDMRRISIDHHIKAGHIPGPTKALAGFTGRYYSTEQAQAIRERLYPHKCSNDDCAENRPSEKP